MKYGRLYLLMMNNRNRSLTEIDDKMPGIVMFAAASDFANVLNETSSLACSH